MDEIDRDLGKRNILVRIIRMRKVPFMDSTGIHNLESLWARSKKEGVITILSGVTQKVEATLIKSGMANKIGRAHIFPHIVPAFDKAKSLIERINAGDVTVRP